MLRMGHQRGRQITPDWSVRLGVRTAHDGRIVVLLQRLADIPVSDGSRGWSGGIVEASRFRVGSDSTARICLPNAACRLSGKGFPLVSARRRIPRHAFALKKYFRATHGSKTSDKKHTLASLGHTAALRVQYSPRQALPPPPPLLRGAVRKRARSRVRALPARSPRQTSVDQAHERIE